MCVHILVNCHFFIHEDILSVKYSEIYIQLYCYNVDIIAEDFRSLYSVFCIHYELNLTCIQILIST